MTKKRFINKGKHIFQHGEWWCSARGEHCADVIATAMNELINENKQLKSLLECSREEANDYCEELMEKDAFIKLYKKENEWLKTRFKEERELAMKINRKCDALTIKKQELELEIIRLEKIIRTGDDNDCNRTS